jgi:RhtB (resistance to homoserine/threonine) family protein
MTFTTAFATYWPEFLGLAFVHFLALVSPGPDFALSVRQSVRFGRRAGVLTALGFGAGTGLHVIYCLLGISALMQATPWLMHAAQGLGAAYLVWMSIGFLRSQPMTMEGLDDATTEPAPSAKKSFLLGFLCNATNPKAFLFFLAIFTTLVSAATPIGIRVFYGIWMCVAIAAWFIFVSFVFTQPQVRQRFLRSGHWFERGMGVVLMGVAARLLFTI